MQWAKAGWGPEYSQEFNQYKNYYVDLSNLTATDLSLLKVSKLTIESIVKKYTEPYNLMVSGGVDSQTMLWCWLNSDTNFNAYCIKYVDSQGKVYNSHDIETLEIFANNHNIEINYLNFNIFNFLEKKLYEYANKYTCTSPQITAHMCMSEMITTGTKIFSGNFIPGGMYNYTILGMDRYARNSGYSVVPFFLMHDPDIAGVLRKYDEIKDIEAPIHYERKIKLLQSAGVPIIPQKEKYTGFELIKDFYDQTTTISRQDKIRYSTNHSKRNFDILFRYKLTNTIKYQDKVRYNLPQLS